MAVHEVAIFVAIQLIVEIFSVNDDAPYYIMMLSGVFKNIYQKCLVDLQEALGWSYALHGPDHSADDAHGVAVRGAKTDLFGRERC